MTGGSDAAAATAPVHEVCLADPNDMSRHSDWDFDFRQVEPGPVETKILLRSGTDITLMEFNINRGVHQKGRSPTETVNFGLPAAPAFHSWRGATVDTPGLVSFGRGAEFDLVTGPEFVGLAISVTPSLLARISDRTGLPLADDFLRATRLPIRQSTPALQRLSDHGHALLCGDGAPFGEPQQEDLVVGLIIAAGDAEEFGDRSAFSMRAKSVTRAIELMEDRLGDDVSIGQLCVDSGASWRTLSRGFQERFGIGPKAYFNRRRLSRVKSDLAEGSASCSVADAANKWGFWHMGQFARDYRAMFGELPSKTLNGAISY